jgi:adenosylhomocysteine nucleosidase
VVASDFVQHDVDTTAVGDPIGLVSTVNQVEFPTWEPTRCVELLEELGFSAVIGRVATGDLFVATKPAKEAIIEKTGALCTEMEGAAIAHVAYRNGVPFVIIRAIADKADNSAEMDYPVFEAIAARRCARVTMAMASKLAEGTTE